MLKVEFRAMGCQMIALLDRGDRQAAQALQQVPIWFEEWEQALSRFRPDSELNQLNEAAGRPFQASPILWDAIQAALKAAEWSGGLVAPNMLRAIERAGYDRSFEALSAMPPGAYSRAVEASPVRLATVFDRREIRLDELHRTITLPPEMKLDLGGTAKGWSAQQAAQRLSVYGPALMDAGGDIAASDVMSSGQPWPIAIADPLQRQTSLGTLALGNCGVATSGIDYRRWLKDGQWKHHIIDPRSGEPADTDLMSVTISGPDLVEAETAAKVVMILGSQAGLAWLEQQPQLRGLLALQDGRLMFGNDIRDYMWSEDYGIKND